MFIPPIAFRSICRVSCLLPILGLAAACGGAPSPATLSESATPEPPPSAPPPSPSPNGRVVRLGLVSALNDRGRWYLSDAQEEIDVLADANIRIDGELTPRAGLNGDLEREVVLFTGTESEGVIAVTDLWITHVIDGPVDAIDADHGQMVVLGQTVLSSGDFSVGDRVSVSGHPSATGQVVATRVVPSTRSGDYFASGIASSVDVVHRHFDLNGARVDYSTAQLIDLPSGAPVDGERLMIRGTRRPGEAVITAHAVSDNVSTLPGADGAAVSLHGIVNSIESSAAADVDGFQVALAKNDCHEDPVINEDATVAGSRGSDGVVAATHFCFTIDAPALWGFILGPIDAIDPEFGTLSILGFRVQPSITTHVVDEADQTLSIADLRIGDKVYAGGSAPDEGLMMANSLARRTASSRSMLRAFDYHVTLADPIIDLYGRQILTDGSTEFYWANNSNHALARLDRTQFFSGSRNWPFWDKICRPSVAVTLANVGDELTASTVVVEPGYC